MEALSVCSALHLHTMYYLLAALCITTGTLQVNAGATVSEKCCKCHLLTRLRILSMSNSRGITQCLKDMEITWNVLPEYAEACGTPSDAIVSMRIVGGRRAEPHSFPWTVAIVKGDRMHCGGALITDRHVLSAGHCFKWDNVSALQALIGLDDLDDQTNVKKRTFRQTVIHEDFTSTAVRDENDIAIATLNKPITFSDTVMPICLPQPEQQFDGKVGTIVGWGRKGVDKLSSRVLMRASLRILSDQQCTNSKLAQHLKPTMMCAFSKGKDGCQGDSGGPLLTFESHGKYVQAGIVSWGIGCADPRYPGVYTKVSNYIDWIRKNSEDGITC